MSDDEDTPLQKFQGANLLVQVMMVVVMVLGPILTAVVVGWNARALFGRQANLPPRVTALEDSVYQQRLNARMDHTQKMMKKLQARQDETRADIRGMRNTINQVLKGVERIECLIENPDSACLNPTSTDD